MAKLRHLLCTKITKNVTNRCDFRSENTQKWVCGRGSTPDLTGEAYRAPRDRLARLQGRGQRWERKWREGKRRKKEGGGNEGERRGNQTRLQVWLQA